MAQMERSFGTAPARQDETPAPAADIESLPALFGRLGDDVMSLVDAKLGLIKVELKEDVVVYTRGVAMMAVGGLVAAVGFFGLLFVAASLLVSQLFSFDPPVNYALGFAIMGLVYLIAGGALLLVTKGRMAAHDPTPKRTLEEIRKDKQWLKNEI